MSRYIQITKSVIVMTAIGLSFFDISPSVEFIISLFAIFVLAEQLKQATEAISHKLGENVGGLLMAFMGNLPEIMISMLALSKGMVKVVQASISGAIIGNLLLGLGLAIVAGGMKSKILTFNRHIARVQSAMVLLASCGLVIPAVFHISNPVEVERMSLEIAFLLMSIYILSLVFTFVTHENLFAPGHVKPIDIDEENHAQLLKSVTSPMIAPILHKNEATEAVVPMWRIVCSLAISAVLLGFVSEVLTDALIPMSQQFGLTDVFMGVILLSTAGNVGEYLNAISFARSGKIDLTIQATMGSATQVSLFVAPVLVFTSYFMKQPLILNFSLYEVAAVLMAASVTRTFTYDGETHWLEGSMLTGVYIMLGLGFYHLAI